MRPALAILALLVASPAQGASVACALWPKSCQPAPPVMAAPVASPASPVVLAPPPAPPRAAVPPAPRQPARAPKPKWKPAPKRKAALPDWCARVPKGTTMGQIEFAAPLWGVTLTDKNRQQAQACLASK